MSAINLLRTALDRASADEANGVELFPAYTRLKRAVERALEALYETPKPNPLPVPSVPNAGATYGREIVQPVYEAAAHIAGVKLADLFSRCRTRELAVARHAAMTVLAGHTSMTLVDIGRSCGGRDHSTALHGITVTRGERTAGGGPRAALAAKIEQVLGMRKADHATV